MAGALLAPPAAGRAGAWADAAAWPPPPIRAEVGATPESRPGAALSDRVLEGAFDGIEGGVYRRLALADRREAALPAGAGVREFDAPIGVPARAAGIFRGDGGPGASLEGLATALEAAWPVGGQGGDGVSWKTAAGQEDDGLVGIKIKNLQLGMTEQQFFSIAQEYFPNYFDISETNAVILNLLCSEDYYGIRSEKIYGKHSGNCKVFILLTKSIIDDINNTGKSPQQYIQNLPFIFNLPTALFRDGKLATLTISGPSFVDLFNMRDTPALDFLQAFVNAYNLSLNPLTNRQGEIFYLQHSKGWSFSAMVVQNTVFMIQLIRTTYDDTPLGAPTFD
jgi:hypothetical protein